MPGSYTCSCKEGYTGDGRSCELMLVDECQLNTHTCDQNAVCEDTHVSYTCTCDPGYKGDGMSCKDVNECTDNLHDCHKQADCINLPGKYECTCKEVRKLKCKKTKNLLTKLRISAHDLYIETGRYTKPKKTPVDERICRFCTTGEIEDEIHLIMKCPYYLNLRNETFGQLNLI